MNFEREVNSMMNRNKNQLGKKSIDSNYPTNESSKFAKFSKTSKPFEFARFNKGNKTLMLSKED